MEGEELRKGLASCLILVGSYPGRLVWNYCSTGACAAGTLKSTGLIKALYEGVLHGYENVLKSGCPVNECVEAEAEGGTDHRVFQSCACQGGSSKKWGIRLLRHKWIAHELSSNVTCFLMKGNLEIKLEKAGHLP